MSFSCDPASYQCTGPAAALLPYPALKYVLSSEPFLGSTNDSIPEGPINRELHKLLKNNCELASLLRGFLTRTYGASVSNAPAIYVVPTPVVSAPSTPASGNVHEVFYADFNVTYHYNGTLGVWVESSRRPKLLSVIAVHRAKVTTNLTQGVADITFSIPTVSNTGALTAFTLDDLKIVYVNNLDAASPVIGFVPGLVVNNPVIRVVLSSPPAANNNYQLVAVFEKVVIS